MEMETDELDFTVNEIERTVLAYGGYIESKSATTRAGASGEDFRYANLLARVPAENYEKLTEYAMGLGTVLDFYDSVTDMSSEYADIQSKLNVKKLEEERLLAFIEESTQIGDRIELEKRLGEVRGDIDLYETNMQSIDRKVDFSSLNINISETGSPAIRPLNANLGERAREGVKASFDSAFMLLQNIVVFMAYVSVPTILIIVSLGAGALVYRKAGKKKE
jgi:hypothetical protein